MPFDIDSAEEPDELEAEERPHSVVVELAGNDAALVQALSARFRIPPEGVVKMALGLALPRWRRLRGTESP